MPNYVKEVEHVLKLLKYHISSSDVIPWTFAFGSSAEAQSPPSDHWNRPRFPLQSGRLCAQDAGKS